MVPHIRAVRIRRPFVHRDLAEISIIPAKLARSLEPFDDPAWLFELKHDGFRSLAYLDDGKCRLVSRRAQPIQELRSSAECFRRVESTQRHLGR